MTPPPADRAPRYAWLLVETWRDGSLHYEGVALTNEAASAWVHSDFEYGHARTSFPCPIVAEPSR